MQGEISGRIQEHLANYLDKPHTIAELNAGAANVGNLKPDDLQATEGYFWHQIQIFSSLRQIYLGTKQGQFIGVERQDSGELAAKITENFPRRSFYGLDALGNRTKLLRFEPNYDLRDRPWYLRATAAEQPVWTEIYTFFRAIWESRRLGHFMLTLTAP